MSRISDAALAFDRELERLGVEADEAQARRAARVVAGASVWERTLGPLLTSRQVQDLLGVSREAIRLFGPSGSPGPDKGWPAPRRRGPVPQEVLDEVEDRFGVLVLPAPGP